jgi:hypothetical protein
VYRDAHQKEEKLGAYGQTLTTNSARPGSGSSFLLLLVLPSCSFPARIIVVI